MVECKQHFKISHPLLPVQGQPFDPHVERSQAQQFFAALREYDPQKFQNDGFFSLVEAIEYFDVNGDRKITPLEAFHVISNLSGSLYNNLRVAAIYLPELLAERSLERLPGPLERYACVEPGTGERKVFEGKPEPVDLHRDFHHVYSAQLFAKALESEDDYDRLRYLAYSNEFAIKASFDVLEDLEPQTYDSIPGMALALHHKILGTEDGKLFGRDPDQDAMVMRYLLEESFGNDNPLSNLPKPIVRSYFHQFVRMTDESTLLGFFDELQDDPRFYKTCTTPVADEAMVLPGSDVAKKFLPVLLASQNPRWRDYTSYLLLEYHNDNPDEALALMSENRGRYNYLRVMMAYDVVTHDKVPELFDELVSWGYPQNPGSLWRHSLSRYRKSPDVYRHFVNHENPAVSQNARLAMVETLDASDWPYWTLADQHLTEDDFPLFQEADSEGWYELMEIVTEEFLEKDMVAGNRLIVPLEITASHSLYRVTDGRNEFFIRVDGDGKEFRALVLPSPDAEPDEAVFAYRKYQKNDPCFVYIQDPQNKTQKIFLVDHVKGKAFSILDWTYKEPEKKPQALTETNLEASDFDKAFVLEERAPVMIAVIDNGWDYNIPDLRMKSLAEVDPVNGIDDDGNGYVDDTFGWDLIDETGLTYDEADDRYLFGAYWSNDRFMRSSSHGTIVTDVALRGSKESRFVFASSPGKFVERIPLNDWSESNYQLLGEVERESVEYVSQKASAERLVVNFSFRSFSTEWENIIADHPEVLFIVAAGNVGHDIEDPAHRDFPAKLAAKYPNVITVAATDHEGNLTPFSNFGPNAVQFGAPGARINARDVFGEEVEVDGTSVSAPYVTALASQTWSLIPNAAATDVRVVLERIAGEHTHPTLERWTSSGGYLTEEFVIDYLEANLTDLREEF